MKRLYSLFVILSLGCLTMQAQSLSSPDGKYTVTVEGMTYRVVFGGKTIVEQSRLGVDIDNRLFESALAVPRGEHDDWCSDLQLKGETPTSASSMLSTSSSVPTTRG